MKKIVLILFLVILSAGAMLYFGIWVSATKILLFPVVSGLYRSAFPSKTAIVQMAQFYPKQLVLPNNLYPIRIDPAEKTDRFIVYATSGNTRNGLSKWLILMKEDGTPIYSIQIPTDCQMPYAAEGGMIIGPYCYLRDSILYTVSDNKIEESSKFESARLDAGLFERIVFPMIDDNGIPTELTQGVTYSHVCEDHKGSCYYKNAKITIRGNERILDGWIISDYLPLREGVIYLILRRNNTSDPSSNTLLKISY